MLAVLVCVHHIYNNIITLLFGAPDLRRASTLENNSLCVYVCATQNDRIQFDLTCTRTWRVCVCVCARPKSMLHASALKANYLYCFVVLLGFGVFICGFPCAKTRTDHIHAHTHLQCTDGDELLLLE